MSVRNEVLGAEPEATRGEPLSVPMYASASMLRAIMTPFRSATEITEP